MCEEVKKSQLAKWAHQVKEFDGNSCVLCGRSANNQYKYRLEAHHIKPKSKFPESALDPANGVTLCHKCHMLVENHKRNGGEEYKPFKEWIDTHIFVTIPKGQKAALEAFAKSKGESVNGLINRLIKAAMGLNEDWEPIPEEKPVSPVHEKAQKYLDKVQEKAKG